MRALLTFLLSCAWLGAQQFPIGVWLQDPQAQINGQSTAQAYRGIGINTWVGIWDWPSEANRYPGYNNVAANALRAAGFTRVYAGEDASAITWLQQNPQHADLFAGLLVRDEPDMRRYQPENEPATFAATCLALRNQLDAAGFQTKQLWANFGKGFAKIPWNGNPFVSQHELLNDFALYTDHLDVASVDFYPITDPYEHPGASGLWFYAEAARNLRYWVTRNTRNPNIPCWGFVECGNPFSDSSGYRPFMPPEWIGAAVWLQLIAGAEGITYFPQHALPAGAPGNPLPGTTGNFPFEYPFCGAVMAAVNAQVQTFAPVLLSGQHVEIASQTTTGAVPPLVTGRRYLDTLYVFAIGNGDADHKEGFDVDATFVLGAGDNIVQVQVVGEDREVTMSGGVLADHFSPYQLHIYAVPVGSQLASIVRHSSR